MCFLPSVAFDTDYELIFFEVGFGLMILCLCSAYGIVSITKSGRRMRAVAKWYRAEMKITNGDNPAIFELKRILSEDGYKEYELWCVCSSCICSNGRCSTVDYGRSCRQNFLYGKVGKYRYT